MVTFIACLHHVYELWKNFSLWFTLWSVLDAVVLLSKLFSFFIAHKHFHWDRVIARSWFFFSSLLCSRFVFCFVFIMSKNFFFDCLAGNQKMKELVRILFFLKRLCFLMFKIKSNLSSSLSLSHSLCQRVFGKRY